MVDPGTLVEAAGSAMSLSEKIVQIVKSARRDDDPRLEEIISAVQFSALTASRQLLSDLRELSDELWRSGLDPRKSVRELYESLEWYNFVSRHRLKGFENRFYSMRQQFSGFIDDLSAVLICSNRTPSLRQALLESREIQKKLQGLVISEAPLGQIIAELLGVGEGVYDRLRGEERYSDVEEPVGVR